MTANLSAAIASDLLLAFAASAGNVTVITPLSSLSKLESYLFKLFVAVIVAISVAVLNACVAYVQNKCFASQSAAQHAEKMTILTPAASPTPKSATPSATATTVPNATPTSQDKSKVA